jgi:hypothetical protein
MFTFYELELWCLTPLSTICQLYRGCEMSDNADNLNILIRRICLYSSIYIHICFVNFDVFNGAILIDLYQLLYR